MAFKTLQQTVAATDVQTGDLLPVARGTGALQNATFTMVVTFLRTIFAPLIAPSFTGGATVAGGATVGGGLTLTGGLTVSGGVGLTGAAVQNIDAVAALNIDWSVSEFHTKSISVNSTFTFSGITAARGMGTLLDLTISSGAVPAWPAAVKWSNGTIPVLGNGRHLIGFVTDDGGVTVIGVLCATALA